MLQSAHEESCNTSNTFDTMFDDAKKPLFPGCKKFTKLSALVRLYNLKVRYGWSNTSFSEFLSIISDLLPENNEIPTSLYEAKKTLGALGLSYQKIDACPNDCCLYRKEYANSTKCPNCGLSRWKINKNSTKENSGVAAKQMWYFPIVPRFIRMFKNLENAKNLRWHAMDRKIDDPKQPGYDINTYLAPLIDDLKILWEEGVWCFDAYKEEYFTLRAVLLWTINDFPAYGTLLDLPGKSKDGMNSRLDLVEMNIRPELAPMVTGKVVSNTIRWLAHGPNCGVMTYEGYMVNGCSYHTKSRDDHRTVQNSGIMLVATTMQVSSAKDKNPVIGDMSFYGIIEDIWEVSYNTFNTVLFKCKWVENKNGVRIDDLHFTLVDLSRIGHSSNPLIIATHGQQVFYISNPVDPRWSVVVRPPQKDFLYKCANDDLGDMLPHYPPVSKWNSTSDIDESGDAYTRLDCEGTWVTT
ncbi:transposon protein, putative, CACTA, En/Spm sub-class [Cucumis melo var. makuwa]|uniref:Transposon protein, putative, CACTA, En/Spm sub-class n=1 Tax=Cucumis melo var. makuwa TaxID=1194695 RepID=A0A5D3BFQ8_CUCMM|nr:transposon protein, putative, CACTA, En/Spm sub-class [Cucumis melo var. makuwa]